MGGRCTCSKQQDIVVQDMEFEQENQQLGQVKIYYANKILIGFYIVNSIKKTKKLSQETLGKLEELLKCAQPKEDNVSKKLNLQDVFEDLIKILKKKIQEMKLEDNELKILDKIHDLHHIRKELIHFYLTMIAKNHMTFYQKLSELVKLNLSDIKKKVLEKENDTVASELNNSQIVQKLQSSSTFNPNPMRRSTSARVLFPIHIDFDLLKSEFTMFFEICFREVDILPKDNVFFKILINKTTLGNNIKLPEDFKHFLMKFFFIFLMKISEFIGNTGDKLRRFPKKEIRKVLQGKAIDKIKMGDIVKEDYKTFWGMMKGIEKDKGRGVSLGKEDRLLKAPAVMRKLSSSGDESSAVARMQCQSLNLNCNRIEKNKSMLNQINKEIPGGIQKNNGKWDLSSIQECKSENEEKKLPESPESARKQPSNPQTSQVFKPGKSTSFQIKDPRQIIEYDIYNGEFDMLNYLYCGTGILSKTNKLYKGTFRMGKKNGMGILYKKISNTVYYYYRGEWGNNKSDGYGTSILFGHNPNQCSADNSKCEHEKSLILQKGLFKTGKFIYGTVMTLMFFEEVSEITKYEGEIDNGNYSGHGTKTKRIIKQNKNSKKIEVELEYSYEGDFLTGKENGKGNSISENRIKNDSYQYEGEFKNGNMHGYGKITYKDNFFIKSYEGFFENNKKFSKYGIVEFKSGDRYEGFFDTNHFKSALGIYFHSSKNSARPEENYFGQFINNKKNGFGRFISPSSKKVLVGVYFEGEKHGIFSLTTNSSIRRETELDNEMLQTIGIMSTCNNDIAMGNMISFTKEDSKRQETYETSLIRQSRMYYLFEYDDIIDHSDKPIQI